MNQVLKRTRLFVLIMIWLCLLSFWHSVLSQTPISAPTPIVIQARPSQRDSLDYMLALIQVVTLICLFIYVYKTWQIASSAAKTMKTQIAVTLIDQLTHRVVQEMLELIATNNVEFVNENGIGTITCLQEKRRNTHIDMNILLNRFQILGHLCHLKVLDEEDLRGIKYEILTIGRNGAIREYFAFLNDASRPLPAFHTIISTFSKGCI